MGAEPGEAFVHLNINSMVTGTKLSSMSVANDFFANFESVRNSHNFKE